MTLFTNYELILLHPEDESKNISKVVNANKQPDYHNEKPVRELNRTSSTCMASHEDVQRNGFIWSDTVYCMFIMFDKHLDDGIGFFTSEEIGVK